MFSVSVLPQIATQIAVLIAKVARLDCPRQWPELIPILLESVKGQDGLQQHRALLTFYHVTKTLASKRLAQDRRLFQDVSPRCCASVGSLSLRTLLHLVVVSVHLTFCSLFFFFFCSVCTTTVCWFKAEFCHTIEGQLLVVFSLFLMSDFYSCLFNCVNKIMWRGTVFSLAYSASRRCCLASVCSFKVNITE